MYRTPSTQEKSEKGTLLVETCASSPVTRVLRSPPRNTKRLRRRGQLQLFILNFVDALAGSLRSFMTFTFVVLFAAAAMFVNHDIRHHSVIRINS